MYASKEELTNYFKQNIQQIYLFGRDIQQDISSKLTSLIKELDIEEAEELFEVVDELATLFQSIHLDKFQKKHGFFRKNTNSKEKLFDHFENVYPVIRDRVKRLERFQYKSMREVVVLKKEEEQLNILEKALQDHIDVVEEFLHSMDSTGENEPFYPATLQKAKELKTSQYLLLQLKMQCSMKKKSFTEMDLLISRIISNTIPVWKANILQYLEPNNGSIQKSEIIEKQENILAELKKIKKIFK